MENAQLVGLARQVVLRRQLDVIANNVANLNTNGFKAQLNLFREEEMTPAANDAFPFSDRPISFVIDDQSVNDFEPGPLVQSGNPLDVALNGRGFFAVQTPQGERWTRDGAFSIDAQGRLVNHSGHQVLTEAGPITFGPEETDVTIGRDGSISTSAGVRGRLRVVDFADLRELQRSGDNLWSGGTPRAAEGVRVAQGTIERSNVSGVTEISRMIQVTRAYQSITNQLRDLDETRRTAIERLAGTNA